MNLSINKQMVMGLIEQVYESDKEEIIIENSSINENFELEVDEESVVFNQIARVGKLFHILESKLKDIDAHESLHLSVIDCFLDWVIIQKQVKIEDEELNANHKIMLIALSQVLLESFKKIKIDN